MCRIHMSTYKGTQGLCRVDKRGYVRLHIGGHAGYVRVGYIRLHKGDTRVMYV